MTYLGHPDQKFGCLTYAQHGDDLMILNLFSLLGIDKPSYLDLGAHHPTTISNTKLLYDRGSRGVNIEANPNLVEAFCEERPEDLTINVGVGTKAGPSMFYMYSSTCGRNTFCPKEVSAVAAEFRVKKEIQVEMITLDEVVDRYCQGRFPHLLSCDLEGLDYDVLESTLFYRSSPHVICVETRRDDGGRMRLLMGQRGYFPYCRMGENLIFVRGDHRDLVY